MVLKQRENRQRLVNWLLQKTRHSKLEVTDNGEKNGNPRITEQNQIRFKWQA